MNNEWKQNLFEKTAALAAQKKEAETLSEYDPARGEIERRYHHNMMQIITSGLSSEYAAWEEKNGLAKYYIVTEGPVADKIYGDQYPVCLSEREVTRLCNEWETNLFDIMHEASAEEIAEYGVYEG